MGWDELAPWGTRSELLEPPPTGADRRRVADALRLLSTTTGAEVDLDAVPAEAVARCRAARTRLAGRPTTVVHGDPDHGSVRVTAQRVALVDGDDECSRRRPSEVRPAWCPC
ncbi:hypothetical protein [Quadrisphaera sp. INWT6]|uniref:hypothetical protein n=1 Tax=Quadrisphaera sp. INWT6 TaxID=2596917 RepID=UPI00189262F9|nr:hypothetical protein [Quadrisphaera sp. INWT6]MBF5082212.1 hypothetical protein [Quadrisphaera sp. INWT6]